MTAERFETFPFTEGSSTDVPAAGYAGGLRAIAETAQRMAGLRARWLNPPERVEEPAPGHPKRPPACDEAANALKDRTLANLCNERLSDAHAA